MCFFSLDKGRRQNNQPFSTELAENSEPAENHPRYVVGLVSLRFLSCFRYGLFLYFYIHVPLSGCLMSLFFYLSRFLFSHLAIVPFLASMHPVLISVCLYVRMYVCLCLCLAVYVSLSVCLPPPPLSQT